MPAPQAQQDRRGGRRLTALLWAGVGLSPLAAVLLLLAGSTAALRAAALLLLLSIIFIGLSIALRKDPDSVRAEFEDALLDEVDALREDVRHDIATAARATHRQFSEKLYHLHESIEALRGELDSARLGYTPGEVAQAPVQAVAPAAGHAGGSTPSGRVSGTGRARIPAPMVGGGVVRHTETVQVTTRHTIVDPHAESQPARGTVYGGTVYGGGSNADPAPAGRHGGADDWSEPVEESWTEQRLRERFLAARAGEDSRDRREPRDRHAEAGDSRDDRDWLDPRDGRDDRDRVDRRDGRDDRDRVDRRDGRDDRDRRDARDWRDFRDAGDYWDGGDRDSRDGRDAGGRHSDPRDGTDRTDDRTGRYDSRDRWDRRGLEAGEAARGEGRRARSYGLDDDDPGADERWSDMRAGDRWASVRTDDRGRELRVGERRAAVHSDDSGTEVRIEDRWASVRREDLRLRGDGDGFRARRDSDDPRSRRDGERSSRREGDRWAGGGFEDDRADSSDGWDLRGEWTDRGEGRWDRRAAPAALPAASSEPSWSSFDSRGDGGRVSEVRSETGPAGRRRRRDDDDDDYRYAEEQADAPRSRSRRPDFEHSDDRWR